MIRAGLYQTGADPLLDEAVQVWPALDAFLSEQSPGGVDESFKRLESCLTSRQRGVPGASVANPVDPATSRSPTARKFTLEA
jgi:hypothetical protein